MSREIEVFVDLAGVPHFAGRLWSRASKGHESASFEYDASWLASPLKTAHCSELLETLLQTDGAEC